MVYRGLRRIKICQNRIRVLKPNSPVLASTLSSGYRFQISCCFVGDYEELKFTRMGPNDPNFEANLFNLSKHFQQIADWVISRQNKLGTDWHVYAKQERYRERYQESIFTLVKSFGASADGLCSNSSN
jgi:hypothetical protein